MNRRLIVLGGAGLAAAGLAYALFHEPARKQDAGGGAPIVAVSVPALTAAEREGAALFAANCAACHGDHASGRDGSGPPLVHAIYEPGHHGDGAFLIAAQNGVRQHHWPFGNMPPVEGVTRDEVAKIVTYVRALQRENGIR